MHASRRQAALNVKAISFDSLSPIVTVWGVGYKVAPARESQTDAATT